MQSLSAPPLGKDELQISAAERRQYHRCRRPERGKDACKPQLQGEPDRIKPGSRNSIRNAAAGACGVIPGDRAAIRAVFHPPTARAGYLRRLRTTEANHRVGQSLVGKLGIPALGLSTGCSAAGLVSGISCGHSGTRNSRKKHGRAKKGHGGGRAHIERRMAAVRGGQR